MGKDRKTPLILRTSPVDLDYAHYHFSDDLADVRNAVRVRKHTTGDTDVSYRVLGHWAQTGLLPDDFSDTDGWRKFNLVERAWIEIIIRLREFGMALEKIARVRENVMWWNKKMQSYPDMEYFLIKAMASETDTYILVLADGQADVGTIGDIELSKAIRGHQDVLLISLKSVLKGIGHNVKKAKPLLDLNKEEIELLSQIRLEGSDEIKLKVRKDGKIKEMEATEIIAGAPKNYEVHKDAKDKRLYGRIITKYEEGLPKSTHVTSRKRFDK